MKRLKVSVWVMSSVWVLGSLLGTAQAAGMSSGSGSNNQPQANPWGGAPTYRAYPHAPAYAQGYAQGYAPHYGGYRQAYPEERNDKKSSAPWTTMNPGRMMNMMPNPMSMFGGNNPRRNGADYPPLPPHGAYPYAPHGYPGAYPYQGAVPLGQQQGAHRSAAPTAPASSQAPTQQQQQQQPTAPQLSYPAPSSNHSGSGMGYRHNQQAPSRYVQPTPNAAYGQYPQQGGGYYPQPNTPATAYQGALVDRGGYQAPPAAMQPPSMNSEKPLVDRGNFPEPPPVPDMPPMRQGFNPAMPYPNFPDRSGQQASPQANTPNYPAPASSYGGQTYNNQISPQAGQAYSIPPVAPGLDLYPGQPPKQDLRTPPPPPPSN